jgi:hypothetical protein
MFKLSILASGYAVLQSDSRHWPKPSIAHDQSIHRLGTRLLGVVVKFFFSDPTSAAFLFLFHLHFFFHSSFLKVYMAFPVLNSNKALHDGT